MRIAYVYILLFFFVVVGCNLIKTSGKLIKVSMVLFAVSLAIIAFYAVPPITWDLYRHFNYLNQIRSSTYGFIEYVFIKNYSIAGGANLGNCYAFNMMRYIICRTTDNNHFLPAVCIFADYLIVGWIMLDWINHYKGDGKLHAIMFLLCFSLMPYVHAVSGMRVALASSIVGLGIYLYLYRQKIIVVWLLLTAIAATIHPVVLITIPIVIISHFELGFKSTILVVGLSAGLQEIARWMYNSDVRYFHLIGSKYYSYTSEDQFRSNMFSYYGLMVIIILLFVRFFIFGVYKNFKNRNMPEKRLCNFIIIYLCYNIGNISNYDMFLRPAYLLGVMAPMIVDLILNNVKLMGKDRNHIFKLMINILVVSICVYMSYRYTEQFMRAI